MNQYNKPIQNKISCKDVAKENIKKHDSNWSRIPHYFTKKGLENLKDPKALVEYSDNVQDVYKNNKEYNLERRLKCY